MTAARAMDIGKAIELLSDCCDRGVVTFDQDFKDAVKMGKKALTLLAYDKAHRLNDESLQLLFGASRGESQVP